VHCTRQSWHEMRVSESHLLWIEDGCEILNGACLFDFADN